MPMLFSPTIGAAVTARYWYLWVRCPACRTTNAIGLRELVRLSRTSIADEMRIEHTRRVLGDGAN